MKVPNIKIKQIIPAPDWLAIKWYPTRKKGDATPINPGDCWTDSITCLAVVTDDEGFDRVLAVTASDCGPEFDGEFDCEGYKGSFTQRMIDKREES